jgi:thiol-disulfide isomerase/thioredoxin
MTKFVLLGSLVLAGALALGGFSSDDTKAAPARKATVLLFLSTDCPVAMQYTPRINRLVEEFSAKGVEFKAYFPNEMESKDAVDMYVRERKYAFPYDLDPAGALARSKGVKTIPTAVVLDDKGKVTYLGAIDDSKQPDKVKKTYLRDAVAAMIEGKKPPLAKTDAFGCILMAGPEPPSVAKVNFAEHVAPILYRACTTCHRPGEVAPFPLTNYEEARKWADNIAAVTKRRSMPPWKAVPGFGDFHGENRLSDLEIATLQNWALAKAPRGDAAKEPKTPTFPKGWALGEPDLVLQPSKTFKLPAEGRDIYRHFVLKTNLKEPVWVTGIDAKPGNRTVVHHVIAFLDGKGRAAKLDGREKDGQEGYNAFGAPGFIPDGALGGWAPGSQPISLPKGVGFRLDPGVDVVLQVHYHLSGKEEVDQTKLGLYFSKAPVQREVRIQWLANPLFRLKAGDANAVVKLTVPIFQDQICYGVMPHMHMLGKSMKAEAELPDGTRKPLIWVQDWDFNWQFTYAFKEPVRLPRGSKVHIEAMYDNSANNPNNPNDPPKDITWGEETTDEMFLLVALTARDTDPKK